MLFVVVYRIYGILFLVDQEHCLGRRSMMVVRLFIGRPAAELGGTSHQILGVLRRRTLC